jgi:6-phosphofructokinase
MPQHAGSAADQHLSQHDGLVAGNAAIGQSGGPTAVINQSLVGVVEGLRSGLHALGRVKRIFGMRHGVKGLTRSEGADLYDLTSTDQDRLDRLAATPSACLGSTRDKPDAAYCERILHACRSNDIRYFFYIGGNDSSDTCRIVSEMAQNDHCPGFPSAARWVAMACMADFLDNISLPGIKINMVMGRNAGFLTAATALARRHDYNQPLVSTDGPQLIYLPEVPFDLDRFVGDVESVYARKGRCHIAVSEGIVDKDGTPIGAKLIRNAQIDAHGNVQLSGSGAVGDQLADLLKERLTPAGGKAPRVRADTFGYVQRCWPDPSPVDSREARRSGRFAAQVALRGVRSASIVIRRVKLTGPHMQHVYASDFGTVELAVVAGKTRRMPAEFISGHNNVSPAFLEYCLPLVGELPGFERL